METKDNNSKSLSSPLAFTFLKSRHSFAKQQHRDIDYCTIPMTDVAEDKTELIAKDDLVKRQLIVCVVLFCNAMNNTIAYPFIIFMVTDLFPGESPTKINTLSGVVAAALPAGHFVSGFLFGSISDRLGKRRPVLMAGLFANIFTYAFFGMSSHWGYFAVLIGNFLCGACNGNIGVCRSSMGDITAGDNAGRSRGFAWVSICFCIALSSGSLIGGVLANPNVKGYLLSGPLFSTFPYLLPCLFSVVISFIGLLVVFFLMEEPTDSPAMVQARAMSMAAKTPSFIMRNDEQDKLEVEEIEVYAANPYQSRSVSQDTASVSLFRSLTDTDGQAQSATQAIVGTFRSLTDQSPSEIVAVAASSSTPQPAAPRVPRGAIYAAFVNGLVGMAFSGFEELFPMVALLPSGGGGVDFGTSQVGYAHAMGFPLGIVCQLFLYPKALEHFGGHLQLFRVCISIGSVCYALFPLVMYVPTSVDGGALLWGVLFLYQSLKFSAFTIGYSCVFVIVSNSTSRHHLAYVTGFAQSLNALGRGLGPILGGAILGQCLEYVGEKPWNTYPPFILLSAICILNVCISFRATPFKVEERVVDTDYNFDETLEDGVNDEGDDSYSPLPGDELDSASLEMPSSSIKGDKSPTKSKYLTA